MVRRLALLLCLAPVLAGCNFEAPAPTRTAAPPTPKPPLSTIAASLSIPQAQIATTLNSLTEDHIADLHDEPVRCGIGTCKLTLFARRTGAIAVGGTGSALALRLPFTANAEIAAPGILSLLRAKGDGNGEADARTEIAVGQDWRLSTVTSGDVRLQSGHLKLGPLTTNIANIWNGNEAKLSRPLWKAMDKKLNGVDLRPQVTAAWSKLFEVLPVSRKPPSWLLLSPEHLRLAKPVVKGGNVVISLALEVRGRVVTQDAAPINRVTRLPPPWRLDKPSDRFAVAVPMLLTYDEAGRIALASLQKRPPHILGMSLRVSQLQILPSGQDVVVAAHFCTDPDLMLFSWLATCGTGYVRGVPRFDAATGVVRVADIHTDTTSAGVGLTLLRWVAGGFLAGTLESRLVFDEQKQIQRLDKQITEALARPQGGGMLSIAADIQSFGAPVFSWTKDGFLASFSAQGRTRTELAL